MLQFKFLGFPVRVDWFFWIICLLLGGGLSASSGRDWIGVGICAAVIFVSIMVHELGHALAARRFGIFPFIHLHGLGGATVMPGARLTRLEGIQVSAAGPAAGLLLGCLLLILNFTVPRSESGYFMHLAIRFGLFVNFFWTLMNLLPIQPLDGGQILRDVLGPTRRQWTDWTGFVVGALVVVWALSNGMIFLAILMGYLAYQNISRNRAEGGVITR